MRIRQLSIRNFRGIREMDWALPCSNVLCLIGRGDSMKSTILEAVRRAFHPQWNLSFSDTDFYRCNPDVPITIDVVLGELPAEFKDLSRYGYLLCGWSANQRVRTEEPGEGLEDALWIRLKVGKDLEPSWRVIRNEEDDGKDFRPSDRQRTAVSLIGSYADRHLTWSKSSILSQITGAESIAASLAEAARAAKKALDDRRAVLRSFDTVAQDATSVARALGVPVVDTFQANLDLESINVRLGGLALHDGDVPARQFGLGSRRILTTGLQKQGLECPHITLFDEVESGLEPHRIARLLKHLKEDETGQYFLTTHSPVVLRELTVKDLFVTQSNKGRTAVVSANLPSVAIRFRAKSERARRRSLQPR